MGMRAAQARAGIEGHEAERLAGRGIDHLQVSSQAAAHNGDLVDQPMLTARKVFSSNLTISAVSDDDTGMTRSMKVL